MSQWCVYVRVVLSRDQCHTGNSSQSKCPNRVLHSAHEATSQYWHTSTCRQTQAGCVTCAHKAALPQENNNRIQSLASDAELCCSVWHKTYASDGRNISKQHSVFSVPAELPSHISCCGFSRPGCIQPQDCRLILVSQPIDTCNFFLVPQIHGSHCVSQSPTSPRKGDEGG